MQIKVNIHFNLFWLLRKMEREIYYRDFPLQFVGKMKLKFTFNFCL